MSRLSLIKNVLGRYAGGLNTMKSTKETTGHEYVGWMLSNQPWKGTEGMDIQAEIKDGVMFSNHIKPGLSFKGTIEGLNFELYVPSGSKDAQPNLPISPTMDIVYGMNKSAGEELQKMFNATRIAAILDIRERDMRDLHQYKNVNGQKVGNAFWHAHGNIEGMEGLLRNARTSFVKEFNEAAKDTVLSMSENMNLMYNSTNLTDPYGTGEKNFSTTSEVMLGTFGHSLTSHSAIRTFIREKHPELYDIAQQANDALAQTALAKDTVEEVIEFEATQNREQMMEDQITLEGMNR